LSARRPPRLRGKRKDKNEGDPLAQSRKQGPIFFARSPERRFLDQQRASLSVMNCGNIQVMKCPELIERLKAYDALLRENGATALFVFGSRARGSERPDSDLDLFIDYDPTLRIPNMFRLMQIEQKISETLGIPVIITTRDALHPLMKKNIEREAVRVA
jgi:predicted nucleotidyltransferase